MRCEDNLISRPIEVLGGMDAETFLRDYWQKAPLLIRQAIPDVRPSAVGIAVFFGRG